MSLLISVFSWVFCVCVWINTFFEQKILLAKIFARIDDFFLKKKEN